MTGLRRSARGVGRCGAGPGPGGAIAAVDGGHRMVRLAGRGQRGRLVAEDLIMDAIAAALGASAVTWSATALGAATVFIAPALPRRALGGLLAGATALMTWAAVAGLFLPAWAGAQEAVPGAAGALAAVGAVAAGAWGVRRIRRGLVGVGEHGPTLGRQLFLVMTLHHVPEGMAVGLAVAAARAGDPLAMAGAGGLVLAMALHNAAEGALVSLPLHQEGMGRGAAWMRGQLSGLAEVAGAVIGAAAVGVSGAVLPWALAAAAGAMGAVVAGDLVPELRRTWTAGRGAARVAA